MSDFLLTLTFILILLMACGDKGLCVQINDDKPMCIKVVGDE